MLDLIRAYENYLTKVKHASSNTISSYMRDIRQFEGWLTAHEGIDVVDATQQNIADYLAHMDSEGRSGATRSRSLASLKNFYSYVVSSGFVERTPVMDIHIQRLRIYLKVYEIGRSNPVRNKIFISLHHGLVEIRTLEESSVHKEILVAQTLLC